MCRSYFFNPKQSGFNLLEMLLVLSIMSMLSFFAIPALSSWWSNQKRDVALSRLYSDMQFARTTALQFQKNVTVCRTNQLTAKTPRCARGTGWENGWLVFYDRGKLGVFEAGDVILRRQPSMVGVTLRGNTNLKNRVTFFVDGMSQNTAGTFAVCDTRGWENGKLLVVTTTGRLRTAITQNINNLSINDCLT